MILTCTQHYYTLLSIVAFQWNIKAVWRGFHFYDEQINVHFHCTIIIKYYHILESKQASGHLLLFLVFYTCIYYCYTFSCVLYYLILRFLLLLTLWRNYKEVTKQGQEM